MGKERQSVAIQMPSENIMLDEEVSEKTIHQVLSFTDRERQVAVAASAVISIEGSKVAPSPAEGRNERCASDGTKRGA